ncbi:MAG: AbrB/MazE/SpoVT family DNA-binding domain-containing protein [Gammaproteobacteria bacterium]|nr:AbrB/MazE/SpoVT family DNA-binding domain-containing protein [Gammaproteobacteria bacterium]
MHNVGQYDSSVFRVKMLVTIEPEFRITLPAELCQRIGLREGDLMEASVVEGGILFSPKAVVDRHAAADRLDEIFARSKPLPEDVGRSEEEIMEDIIEDIAKARKEYRDRGK